MVLTRRRGLGATAGIAGASAIVGAEGSSVSVAAAGAEGSRDPPRSGPVSIGAVASKGGVSAGAATASPDRSGRSATTAPVDGTNVRRRAANVVAHITSAIASTDPDRHQERLDVRGAQRIGQVAARIDERVPEREGHGEEREHPGQPVRPTQGEAGALAQRQQLDEAVLDGRRKHEQQEGLEPAEGDVERRPVATERGRRQRRAARRRVRRRGPSRGRRRRSGRAAADRPGPRRCRGPPGSRS